MSDQQDFETLLPKLNALDRKSIRKQDMPIDQAVKEGEIMAAAATADSAALTAIGMDAAKITELASAVSALRYTQAAYIAAIGELKDASKQWAGEEPKGYELRNELLAAASYGLRSVPDAMKAVKRIREGSGGADMIQDLSALAELCKKYQPQLLAIKFDTSMVDAAVEKAGTLGKLYAKAFVEKGTSLAKDARDRAFTYMRLTMADVLAAAEYAFRKDNARLSYYHSAYRSRQASASTDPAPAAAPVPATGQAGAAK
jgi:hypothetical protein